MLEEDVPPALPWAGGAAALGHVINCELLGSSPACLKTSRPFYVQSADS